MSQITDGLVNGGATGHFNISYEETMSAADGRSVAQGLMNVIESDLALITRWFAGTSFAYAYPITVELHNASGGAGWNTPPGIAAPTYHPTITVKGLNPTSGDKFQPDEQGLDYVRYLIVSEVTEMFMASKNNGWSENVTVFTSGDEGSKGEGLSRFLGRQFRLVNGITGPFKGYDVVNQWLPGPAVAAGDADVTRDGAPSAIRPDYVEGSPDDVTPDIVTGCTTCFLYYLHDQLGYSIPAIIDAGSETLAGVYQKLTGRTDAWDSFIGLVNAHYPLPVADTDMNGDNIFPVASLRYLDNGVRLTAGASANVLLQLDRPTPVSITVKFASDDPSRLAVPASLQIPFGQQDIQVPVTALPVAGFGGVITLHATYANETISAPVTVLPAASVLGGVVYASATGEPVAMAGVLITGTPPSQISIQHLTGPDGSWTTATIPPDTYTVEVTAGGYVPATVSVVVAEGVPSTRQDVALTVSRPFTVKGTVRDQSGAPLQGAAVILVSDDSTIRLTATTGVDGAYSFTQDPGVFTGGYTLDAQLAGHTRIDFRLATIDNGATVEEDLILSALGGLNGVITDAKTAAPIAGATVSARDVTATSESTGRYALQVAPGSVAVTVAANGFEVANASTTVPPGGAAQQDFALIEASATLTGTVFNATTNLGVRDALVRVTGAAAVRSGSDGTYTIARVPAGQAQLVGSAQGYGDNTVTIQVAAEQTLTVDLYLSSGPNPHPH